MGNPIAPNATNQRDCTQVQQVFLQFALVEYTNEEREFQVLIHGGKPTNPTERPDSVKGRARSKLKDPRTIKRKV